MCLDNNGELNTMQRLEFKSFMRGFAKGAHSLNEGDLTAVAIQFVQDRSDFHRRSFGVVMGLIDDTVSDIMEDYQ